MKRRILGPVRKFVTVISLAITAHLPALVVLLAGCGGRPAATRLSSEATPIDPKLEDCDLTTSDGVIKGTCGTLVVPVLRQDSTSELIRLPFQRIAASAPAGLPIVYIGDGPGMSSYQFRPTSSLLVSHDLLLVGARGVDGARTLDCPEVGRALAAPTSSWEPDVANALNGCVKRLAGDGVRLSGYGVIERIADIERARELAGYERMHIVADGFGAVIARAYAQAHPERVERMVFIGPTPTTQPVGTSADAMRVLAAYQDICARDSTCAERGAAIADTMRTIDIPKRWLIYRIDRGRVLLATSLQLAYRRGAMLALGAWQDAAAGDVSGIGQTSWGTDIMLTSSFVWGTALLELASLNYNSGEESPALLPSATVVTSIANRGVRGDALPAFADIPAEPPPQPTLVIHGELDPRFSEATLVAAMQRELTAPRFTRVAGYGSPSELWGVAPELLAQTMVRFLDGRDAPGELAPQVQPPGMRLSTMAKLVVAAIAAFPLFGILVVWLLLKRLRTALRRDAARPATA